MKIEVLYRDTYDTERTASYDADDFDLDDFANLHILKDNKSIAVIASGRWLGVAQFDL